MTETRLVNVNTLVAKLEEHVQQALRELRATGVRIEHEGQIIRHGDGHYEIHGWRLSGDRAASRMITIDGNTHDRYRGAIELGPSDAVIFRSSRGDE